MDEAKGPKGSKPGLLSRAPSIETANDPLKLSFRLAWKRLATNQFGITLRSRATFEA